MGVADLPLLQQIKGRLGWLDERQRVVAQNVANSDTPGYVARDLKAPTDFARAMAEGGGLRMTRTSAAHISPPGPVTRFTASDAPDSETTLDGNSVVVEEQMLKMAESRMAYDAAIGFYQKSMQMIRMAAKPPGR
ncbi:MAG: flagellar basal body rod protein FlgB [Brevundimonas sp.]|jgi:flagellar basal-body rod protein FlgB|uniref:flagellar basal body rod protein FlgB n=1 Tax=unclassified Brevundimonas TaxID=2622653 RepID=UPI001072CFEA|nr:MULTISPECIES: flagellar basal body rod protein FlgB [unclassified Brevundimonas]QBX38532.1 flagellar basal body rod protein FlgB [Brevundimonas sp. MF30-B]TFW02240.1 flagellar basal body rod protein FlgB [Brevundimonas sp. S30B]